MATSSLPPFLARELVTGQLEKPTIFKGTVDDWQCRHWDLNEWAARLGQQRVRFRVGEIDPIDVDPVFEGDCDYINGTIDEFNAWLNNGIDVTSDSEFKELNPADTWCYADYKYMAELFSDDQVLKAVNWKSFGFPERSGKESSLWIGSKGSNTPCHYDTYGCNLVAQLYGMKRWILFPPAQSDHMQPTRIPYEESSVFSKINIKNPQLDKYPSFKETTPYVVCLVPGDVLFVPRHWWHFVESMETSIAINTWLELSEDDNIRLEESITKLLITCLAPTYNVEKWLNPTEEFTLPEDNLKYVQVALKKCISNNNHKTNLAAQSLLQLSAEEINETSACRKRPRPSSSSPSNATTCETSSIHIEDVNSDRTNALQRTRAGEGCQKRKMETTLDDTLQKYNDSVMPLQAVSFKHYLHLLNESSADSRTSSRISINPARTINPEKGSRQSSDNIENVPPQSNFSHKLINCLVNPKTASVVAELLKKTF